MGCQNTFGTNLASIHSAADAQQANIDCVDHNCWIGLYSPNKNGQWQWSDGTPYNYVDGWNVGRPDNANGNQWYVMMYHWGGWDDDGCCAPHYPLCNGSPTQPPTTKAPTTKSPTNKPTTKSPTNKPTTESSDKASIAESGSDSNNDGDTDSSNDDNDDTSNDPRNGSNDGDDEDSEEEDDCIGLKETDCRSLQKDDGDQKCGVNLETGDCFSIERRAGHFGAGNFDDGFVAAQKEHEDETNQLFVVVVVLGVIIGSLVLVIIGGGYYFYTKTNEKLHINDIEMSREMEMGQTNNIEADDQQLINPHVTRA